MEDLGLTWSTQDMIMSIFPLSARFRRDSTCTTDTSCKKLWELRIPVFFFLFFCQFLELKTRWKDCILATGLMDNSTFIILAATWDQNNRLFLLRSDVIQSIVFQRTPYRRKWSLSFKGDVVDDQTPISLRFRSCSRSHPDVSNLLTPRFPSELGFDRQGKTPMWACGP